MGIILTENDFKLIDTAIANYTKTGKTDCICPYCRTKIIVKEKSSSIEVTCETNDCLSEGFRGL